MATVAYLILRYPLCDWFGCIHNEGSRLEQVCICTAQPAVAFVIITLAYECYVGTQVPLISMDYMQLLVSTTIPIKPRELYTFHTSSFEPHSSFIEAAHPSEFYLFVLFLTGLPCRVLP